MAVNNVSLKDIPAILSQLTLAEQEKLLAQLEKLDEMKRQKLAQEKFIKFVEAVWPTFIGGRHHARMADAFERVASGKCKRLIVNMPPRHSKSEFASYLLPAWFLGKFPHKKVIQCSHTAELAVGFGRKVRNLVDTDAYREIFPDLALQSDSKAAGRWNTSKGGDYFAIGVGGAVTGKGADVLIIDDPHALEVSTPIATLEGFVELQHLKVGDFVFGPDGEPTRVIAKSPVYKNRNLYSVTTYDGEVIYADAKHVWNVRTSTRVKDPYKNVATENLVSPRSSPFMLPRHQAVQYMVKDLPIDPWVLGAWLGDGTSSLGRMTAHPDDATFMRGEFRRRGYETTDLADKFSFGVPGLRAQLIAAGLLDNKHIPEAYLTASFHQRMDLLCGLIDTDGNVTASGQCVFHNKDEKLVAQVVELLHSLGRKCQRRSYVSKGKFGTCVMHRVCFKLKDCALMPRKRMRTRTTHDKQHRSITVQKTEAYGDVQCITVERADGLFLAGRGYIVTHNSEQEAAIAETNPDIYDKTYEWYTSGPRQRLQPGGAIVVVMCMTGDTLVLRPDGSETLLKDLHVGDTVATYEGGEISTARVTNFQSNGVDDVFIVKTQSGITVKANERHPFLVEHNGVRKWARLRDLIPGMLLVRKRDASAPQTTYEFIADPIVEITPVGRAEVFDIEIERTENFIANGLVVHNTRWSKRDLTGEILKAAAARGGDDWEIIEFPAILPSGNPLWPEFWPMEELSVLRDELPNSKWQAQYQQNPISESAAIVKREWWKTWESDRAPTCDFILQTWDTAFEKTQRADYSACTTWGVFYHPDEAGNEQANIILLNAFRDRMEFPELKRCAIEEYKEWEPDSIIVEKKASGAPLIYEMRAMGIPVQEFTPTRGNDKISRLNAVSDLFASGRVWAPATRWAEEVIDEVAEFPAGSHDDYVDTVSMALHRFRRGGYISTNLDEPEDTVYFKSRRGQGYY